MRTTLCLLCVGVIVASAACFGGDDDSQPTATPAAEASATARPPSGGRTMPPSPTSTAAAPATVSTAAATPTPGVSGRAPSVPTPSETPRLGPDGVPLVPPLKRLTFSAGTALLQSDLDARGYGQAARGARNTARLIYPRLAIDAAVETQLVGANGQMPEPSAAEVVAWYDFGIYQGIGGLPLSGGNAVFAGDIDRVRVGTGVFWRLEEAAQGDVVTLELTDGRRLYYYIEFNKVASRDVDFTSIVSATADESATFITATGPFDPSGYANRRIVWARRINCESGGVNCQLPQ